MCAYVAHPTVVSGQTWTASNQNTYVKDNLAELWKYTAAGDMVYGTSATQTTTLGIGSAYSLLRSTGTAPAWTTIATVLQNSAAIASQAAEDLLVGSSATAIKRLPKGSNYDMLKMSGAGVVEWGTLATLMQNTAIIASQAAGDIVYPNGATSVARLAKPAAAGLIGHNATAPVHYTPTAANQIFISDGTSTPKFENIGHITQVKRSSDLSYSRSTTSGIAWNAENIDDDGQHDNSTNPSRITAAATGWYRVTAFVSFTVANSDWAVFLYLKKNGTEFGGTMGWGGTGGGTVRVHGASGVVQATAGEYFEVMMNWNGTGATTTIDTLSLFTVERIR